MDKLGVAYALVGRHDFRPVTPVPFRQQPLGGHKPAPAMPGNSLAQEFTIDDARSLYAVGLVLATYHRPRAPSDVQLSLLDVEGRLIARAITKAGHVKDNKEAMFEFESPIRLQPGRYRMAIELTRSDRRGRLTAWSVDRPAHSDDLILINGEPRPGAMIYTLYTAKPFNEQEWLLMQHQDETNTLLLINRRVPGGAYFVNELDERADWSDELVTTRVVNNQTIEVDYSGDRQGFIVLPGGFGTMDELFEVLTLIQTKKIDRVPVVLVGTEYWSGLREWIINKMLNQEHNIKEMDLELMPVYDDPDQVIKYINDFYAEEGMGVLQPNYEL